MRELGNVICLDICSDISHITVSGVTEFCDLVQKNEYYREESSLHRSAQFLAHTGLLIGMQDILRNEQPLLADAAMLKISSSGGDPTAAMVMHDRIRELSTPVIGYAMGQVSSAALLPFAACTERVATPASIFVIHQSTSLLQGQVSSRQLSEYADLHRHINRTMAELIARACGKSVRSVRRDIEQSRVLNAREAKAYGLVHEIVDRLDYTPVAAMRTSHTSCR